MGEDSGTATDLDVSEESLRDKSKGDTNGKKKREKKKSGKVLPKEKEMGIHINILQKTCSFFFSYSC